MEPQKTVNNQSNPDQKKKEKQKSKKNQQQLETTSIITLPELKLY